MTHPATAVSHVTVRCTCVPAAFLAQGLSVFPLHNLGVKTTWLMSLPGLSLPGLALTRVPQHDRLDREDPVDGLGTGSPGEDTVPMIWSIAWQEKMNTLLARRNGATRVYYQSSMVIGSEEVLIFNVTTTRLAFLLGAAFCL